MGAGLRGIASRYGSIDFQAVDIRNVACSSIDLRKETGALGVSDETQVVPAGTFEFAVFSPKPGCYPVGEIRIWYAGAAVSIVREPTHRPGVIEITPALLDAAAHDPAYAATLRAWIQSQC